MGGRGSASSGGGGGTKGAGGAAAPAIVAGVQVVVAGPGMTVKMAAANNAEQVRAFERRSESASKSLETYMDSPVVDKAVLRDMSDKLKIAMTNERAFKAAVAASKKK